MKAWRPLRWLMTTLLCLGLCGMGAGCRGYRLGSTLPPGIEIVHVRPFLNETVEPLLEIETTQATMSEIQRDGTLSVSDMEKADVVLDVVLTDFSLDPVRYEGDATTTAREYRMTIQASVVLTAVPTGEVLVRDRVVGETDFQPTGDLSSAKRSALPAAARDLADRIVTAVVEFW